MLQSAEPLGCSPSLADKAGRVEAALSAIPGDSAGAVMLINPLAARLGAHTLRKAVESFDRDRDTPLVSVEAPRDHPCQLYSLTRIAGLGFAPLFDPDGDGDASRAFPFNWAARNGVDLPENVLLREEPGVSGVRYVPASAQERAHAPCLWEKVAESAARIHVSAEARDGLSRSARSGETLAGVGLDAEREFGTCSSSATATVAGWPRPTPRVFRWAGA